jgi:hypothetical protein
VAGHSALDVEAWVGATMVSRALNQGGSMHALRTIPVLIAAAGLLVACGDDDDASPADSTPPATEVVTTTAADVTTTAAEATTTVPEGLEQPAIWPAAGVVFATPEEAAADFVTEVLGVPAELGEFQQGDSRSGEIEVLSPGEGGAATHVGRGILFLRQLGPDDGWFVIGAGSDEASITVPDTGAEVSAGPLDVEGISHGFEASATVSAILAGDASRVFDSLVIQAGSMEEAGPFAVSLDLSEAAPGDVVMLLVQGGVGLETDPGEFGAIPVVIAG